MQAQHYRIAILVSISAPIQGDFATSDSCNNPAESKGLGTLNTLSQISLKSGTKLGIKAYIF